MYRWIERLEAQRTPLDIITDNVARQRFISETCLRDLIQRRYRLPDSEATHDPAKSPDGKLSPALRDDMP